MDLQAIFEPARSVLAPLGFQSPKAAPTIYARPLSEDCWAYFHLRGTEAFVAPVTAFTLPVLGAIMLEIEPRLRAGPELKDFDSRFLPPLLHDDQTLLDENDPVWGPAAGQSRGAPLGPEEFHALAQSMDRFATQRQEEGWTEDRVMQQLLAAPADHPHAAWSRWLAPIWFAKRDAWGELAAFEQTLDATRTAELDVWKQYAAKVRERKNKF